MSALSYLRQRAGEAVLSTTERSSVATSIATLQSRLNSHFSGTGQISSHFIFGSYTRDTILPRLMDAHSDIDYLVVFSDSGYTPQTYLDRLRRFVEAKYPTSEIYQSSPTIVLELNHIKFELVPALAQFYGGYQIPSGPSAWQPTNPNDFNTQLATKHAAEGYNIKQVVRLAKYWNAKNGYVYDSFSFEKYIIGLFFWNCSNERDYLFSVFDQLPVPNDTQWRKNAVERAKKIVSEARQLEKDGYPNLAESEIKKLIPVA